MTNLSYERPTLTDLGTVEDLTQGTINYKTHVNGVDVTFNKKKIVIKLDSHNAGYKHIS